MNRTLIVSLIGTKGGWLSRQLLKFITIGSSSVTAWLLAKDVPAETTTLLVTGIVAGVSWAAELGLSKLASKIAIPCLALFMLSSCGTSPLGEKTFLGLTQGDWITTGKAAGKGAVQAGLPIALSERAKTAAKEPVNVQP